MIEVRVEDCTGEVNTCPIVTTMMDRQIFEESIADIDPSAMSRAEVYDAFVTACIKRNCPGMNIELYQELARRRREGSE
jgi:hypothetical protein